MNRTSAPLQTDENSSSRQQYANDLPREVATGDAPIYGYWRDAMNSFVSLSFIFIAFSTVRKIGGENIGIVLKKNKMPNRLLLCKHNPSGFFMGCGVISRHVHRTHCLHAAPSAIRSMSRLFAFTVVARLLAPALVYRFRYHPQIRARTIGSHARINEERKM